MSIQVNPLETWGLSALAGQHAPVLNLQNTGVQLGGGMLEYVKTLMQNKNLAQQQSETQAQTQRANIQAQGASNVANIQAGGQANVANINQQGQMNVEQARAKSSEKIAAGQQGIEQQQTTNLGQFQQGQLANATQGNVLKGQEIANTNSYQQQMVNVEQQKAAADSLFKSTQTKLMLGEAARSTRGSASAGILASVQGITDPTKLSAILNQGINSAHKDGTIGDDEYKQLQTMSPQQQQQAITMDYYTSMKADEIAKTQPMLAQNIANGTIGPTQKTNDKIQQTILGGKQMADNLDTISKKYDSAFTTVGGAAENAAGYAFDKSPLLKSATDAVTGAINSVTGSNINPQDAVDFHAKRSEFYADVKNQIINTVQALSPNVRATPALLKTINDTLPQDGIGSDAEQKAQLKSVMDLTNGLIHLNVQAAMKGLNPSQIDAAQNQIMANFKVGSNTASNASSQSSTGSKTATIKGSDGKQYTIPVENVDKALSIPGTTRIN